MTEHFRLAKLAVRSSELLSGGRLGAAHGWRMAYAHTYDWTTPGGVIEFIADNTWGLPNAVVGSLFATLNLWNGVKVEVSRASGSLLEAGRLGPKRGHADVARQGQSHWTCVGPSRGGRLEFRMERKGQLLAAAGTVIFFGLAPGVVAGLIRWWLTGWRITNPIPVWGPMRVLGAALTVGAAIVLISAFARFVMQASVHLHRSPRLGIW